MFIWFLQKQRENNIHDGQKYYFVGALFPGGSSGGSCSAYKEAVIWGEGRFSMRVPGAPSPRAPWGPLPRAHRIAEWPIRRRSDGLGIPPPGSDPLTISDGLLP